MEEERELDGGVQLQEDSGAERAEGRLEETEVLTSNQGQKPTTYFGLVVTPENRQALIAEHGKDTVNASVKAYKAWVRGKLSFNYKGRRYPVMGKEWLRYVLEEQVKENIANQDNLELKQEEE